MDNSGNLPFQGNSALWEILELQRVLRGHESLIFDNRIYVVSVTSKLHEYKATHNKEHALLMEMVLQQIQALETECRMPRQLVSLQNRSSQSVASNIGLSM